MDVVARLEKPYKGIVFVCYEKSDDFCHRHIFADYMRTHFNIDIEELII